MDISIKSFFLFSTLLIQNDHGGQIIDYAERAFSAKHIIIDGYCASACTIYLRGNYCVTRRSVLVFHSASDKRANRFLMNSYPPKVRKWINTQGGLTQKKLILKGKLLQSLLVLCK